MQRLEGTIKDYAWGSPTLVPELLGRTPDGSPQAELWLGAHPSAPSRLADGDALDAAVEADPAMVGRASVQRFGPRLPYLLKLLGAAQPLSLQAHPTREQAEAGWAREEESGPGREDATRNYSDDWPKPEMIVALTDFAALCGFADPARTSGLWRQLQVPGLAELVERLGPGDADALPEVLDRLLGGEDWGATCTAAVRAAEGVLAGADGAGDRDAGGDAGGDAARTGLVDVCRTAVQTAEHYPGDPGVLVAMLMNRVVLRPGEALFLGAGNLHAYLSGLGVEVMASSDNVLRGGLTPKHVDVAELSSVLDFRPIDPRPAGTVDEGEGRVRFNTPAPEFTLWRLDCADTPTTVPAGTTGRIVVVTRGRVLLRSGGDALTLHQGDAAFLPAGEQVAANGAGTAYLAAPGVR